jgi:glycosyltransferase involved in cell wall biosynthesis
VRREAPALVRAGYQVTVIAPGMPAQPWRELVDGVRVLRFPSPRESKGMLSYIWEYGYSLIASALLSIYAAIRYGFDVVHAHNPPDFFVLIGLFYKLFGKQFVFDHHDLSPEIYRARFGKPGNGLVLRILTFFEILSCRAANHIVATNESYKAMEQRRSGVPADRITVVRNGPELDRVCRVAPDANLRSKAPVIIGYVGTLGVQDGIDYLLRALHHLQQDLGRDDFYCVVIGSGVAQADLERLTIELALTDRVGFTGFLTGDELLATMSAADIFVTPDPSNDYNDRSTMIKMMEYMALERPIVAFDLPEHRVSAGKAALYAVPNHESDFAAKLSLLMDDFELRSRMGAEGRRRVEEELAWSYQADALIGAYSRLFQTRKKRRVATPIPMAQQADREKTNQVC